MMKKILLLIAFTLVCGASSAQLFKKRSNVVEPIYQTGAVSVVNGKVTFEESIPADGLSASEIEEKVNAWIKSRYVEPKTISVKRYESEKPGCIIIKGEEYIVFRNTFLVLNRARIYYYLTITAKEGVCDFNMSRITYWHDEENDNGGIHLIAEDWITDDMAFDKKGRLKNYEGKFRCKTIDLKDQLVSEIKNILNSK